VVSPFSLSRSQQQKSQRKLRRDLQDIKGRLMVGLFFLQMRHISAGVQPRFFQRQGEKRQLRFSVR